jgi:hypothetical protein
VARHAERRPVLPRVLATFGLMMEVVHVDVDAAVAIGDAAAGAVAEQDGATDCCGDGSAVGDPAALGAEIVSFDAAAEVRGLLRWKRNGARVGLELPVSSWRIGR